MDESLIPLIILCSYLSLIVILPRLLIAGMKRIADPVPVRIPLALSVLVLFFLFVINAVTPEGGNLDLPVLVVFCLLQLILIVLGAMTPYYWLSEKKAPESRWPFFTIFTIIGSFLWLWTTMGEQRLGGPYSLFTPMLPLTGWLLDGIVWLTSTGSIVYYPTYPVYFTLRNAGLYLEIFIIAGMYFFLERDR